MPRLLGSTFFCVDQREGGGRWKPMTIISLSDKKKKKLIPTLLQFPGVPYPSGFGSGISYSSSK